MSLENLGKGNLVESVGEKKDFQPSYQQKTTETRFEPSFEQVLNYCC